MDLRTRLWGRYHVPQNVFLVIVLYFTVLLLLLINEFLFCSVLSTYVTLSENVGRIYFQKTIHREPRIGDECTDVNKPKNNVYGEKYPVAFSVQVRNIYTLFHIRH